MPMLHQLSCGCHGHAGMTTLDALHPAQLNKAAFWCSRAGGLKGRVIDR
jgi:hypothetical protein